MTAKRGIDDTDNEGAATMGAVAISSQVTPEAYFALSDHERFELVDEQLVEVHTSALSSWAGGRLNQCLGRYVDAQQLDWTWPADNLYRCFPGAPDNIRKPDVSFIRRGRMTLD